MNNRAGFNGRTKGQSNNTVSPSPASILRRQAMAKSLDEWILELKERFDKDELEKQVVRAMITIGLTDLKSNEMQYHTLEYIAKKPKQSMRIVEARR